MVTRYQRKSDLHIDNDEHRKRNIEYHRVLNRVLHVVSRVSFELHTAKTVGRVKDYEKIVLYEERMFVYIYVCISYCIIKQKTYTYDYRTKYRRTSFEMKVIAEHEGTNK